MGFLEIGDLDFAGANPRNKNFSMKRGRLKALTTAHCHSESWNWDHTYRHWILSNKGSCAWRQFSLLKNQRQTRSSGPFQLILTYPIYTPTLLLK